MEATEEDALRLRDEGRFAFEAGKFLEASALFAQACQAVGICARFEAGMRCNQSAALMSARDYTGALEAAEMATQADPEFAKAFLRKGEAEAAKGEWQQAFRSFSQAEGLSEGQNENQIASLARNGLDAVSEALDADEEEREEEEEERKKSAIDTDAEIKELEKAAEDRERAPAAKEELDRATSALASGSMVDAMDHLEAAFQADNTTWQAAFQLGILLWKLECPGAALKWVQNGLKAEPRFISGHILHASLLSSIGISPEDVEGALASILMSIPCHLDLSLQLAANLVCRQGRLSEAAEFLRGALKGPNDGRPRAGTVLLEKSPTAADYFSQGMVEMYLGYATMLQGLLGEPLSRLLLAGEHCPMPIMGLALCARSALANKEFTFVASALELLENRLLTPPKNQTSDDATFDSCEENESAREIELLAEVKATYSLCAMPQTELLRDKTQVAKLLRESTQYVPETYLWPEEKKNLHQAVANCNPDEKWIVRLQFPIDMDKASCASKIVTSDVVCSEVQAAYANQKKMIPKCNATIVQKYIRAPLLYSGRKFTVRCYVTILRTVPEWLVFLSEKGDVDLCSDRYCEDEPTERRHFTLSSRRENKNLTETAQKPSTRISMDELMQSEKWTWTEIWSALHKSVSSSISTLSSPLCKKFGEVSAFAHGTLGIPTIISMDVLLKESLEPIVLRVRNIDTAAPISLTRGLSDVLLDSWKLSTHLLRMETDGRGIGDAKNSSWYEPLYQEAAALGMHPIEKTT